MPFEQTVEQHHKLTYANNAMMVAQQMANPLRQAVTIVPATGEAHNVAQLLQKKKARRSGDYDRDNPDNRTRRTARWISRGDIIDDGELVDTVDKWDTAMDPTGQLVRGSIAAVEREVADVIMGIEELADGSFRVSGSGILGLATEGKRKEIVTGLPAGNVETAAGTGLTLDKLRKTLLALRRAEFGMEGSNQLYAAVSPQQLDDLLAIAAASGPALNAFQIQQLIDGRPTPLLGINWIWTNRLPVNANGDRMVPVWSKDNIAVGFWEDVNSRIWNNTAKRNLPYIYTSATLDAVRIQDAGVRVIECVEP